MVMKSSSERSRSQLEVEEPRCCLPIRDRRVQATPSRVHRTPAISTVTDNPRLGLAGESNAELTKQDDLLQTMCERVAGHFTCLCLPLAEKRGSPNGAFGCIISIPFSVLSHLVNGSAPCLLPSYLISDLNLVASRILIRRASA